MEKQQRKDLRRKKEGILPCTRCSVHVYLFYVHVLNRKRTLSSLQGDGVMKNGRKSGRFGNRRGRPDYIDPISTRTRSQNNINVERGKFFSIGLNNFAPRKRRTTSHSTSSGEGLIPNNVTVDQEEIHEGRVTISSSNEGGVSSEREGVFSEQEGVSSEREGVSSEREGVSDDEVWINNTKQPAVVESESEEGGCGSSDDSDSDSTSSGSSSSTSSSVTSRDEVDNKAETGSGGMKDGDEDVDLHSYCSDSEELDTESDNEPEDHTHQSSATPLQETSPVSMDSPPPVEEEPTVDSVPAIISVTHAPSSVSQIEESVSSIAMTISQDPVGLASLPTISAPPTTTPSPRPSPTPPIMNPAPSYSPISRPLCPPILPQPFMPSFYQSPIPYGGPPNPTAATFPFRSTLSSSTPPADVTTTTPSSVLPPMGTYSRPPTAPAPRYSPFTMFQYMQFIQHQQQLQRLRMTTPTSSDTPTGAHLYPSIPSSFTPNPSASSRFIAAPPLAYQWSHAPTTITSVTMETAPALTTDTTPSKEQPPQQQPSSS